MEDTNQGLHQEPEPTQQGVQNPAEVTQDPSSSQPQASNPDTRFQELEQSLATERTRSQNLEQLARQQQSRADQATARMQALAGIQPKADPLADDIKRFTDKGIAPEDARLFAGFVQEKVSQVEQKYQQQSAALQATQYVEDAIGFVGNKYSSYFQDQSVVNEIRNTLRQDALQGRSDLINNEDYILDLAFMANGRRQMQAAANPTQHRQQQVAQNNNQSIPSMMGSGSQFRPALPIQNQPAANPLVDQMASQMESYWKQPSNK